MRLEDFFDILPKKQENKSMYSFYRKYMIDMDDYSKPDSETNLITFKALDYNLESVISLGTVKLYLPNFQSCLLAYQPKFKRIVTVFDNYIFIDRVLVGLLTDQKEYGHGVSLYDSLVFLKDKDFKIKEE